MTQMLVVRLEYERARAMAAALEAWKQEHHDVPPLDELEDMIRATMSTLPFLRNLVGKLRAKVATGTVEEFDHPWQAMLNVIDICKESSRTVHELAQKAADGEGRTYTLAAEHAAFIQELEGLGQEVYDSWPQDDPSELAAAQDYARQVLPNDELLRLAKDFPPPQSWYDEESKPPRPTSL